MAKKKVKTSKCSVECSTIMGLLIGVGVFIFMAWYICSPNKPKYEVGTCLLSRDFKFLRVYNTFNHEYELEQLSVSSSNSLEWWFLYESPLAPTVFRTRSNVEENYTVIPCQSKSL